VDNIPYKKLNSIARNKRLLHIARKKNSFNLPAIVLEELYDRLSRKTFMSKSSQTEDESCFEGSSCPLKNK
jgi:hypothetical protein